MPYTKLDTIKQDATKQRDISLKKCSHCKQFKNLFEFHKNKLTEDGLHKWCKNCRKEAKNGTNSKCSLKWQKLNSYKVNARNKEYKQKKRNSMPAWANKFFIEEAYHLAQIRTKLFGFSWHVDHIIPLQGKNVCGFHIETNLQVIPAKENLIKGNKHQWN